MKRIFIGQFLQKKDAEIDKRISQAGNTYQNKVIEILKPDLSISIIPFFENKKKFVFHPDKNVSFICRSQCNSNKWFSKMVKLYLDIKEANTTLAKSDIEMIWFYNVNITFFLLGLYLKMFNKKKLLFAIIADYDNSNKFIPSIIRIFIRFGLEGVIVLNENIYHQNKLTLPGILFKREIIQRQQPILRKTVLMSGSLGKTTGFELALKYFSQRQEYKLIITGKPFRYAANEFEDLLNNYVKKSSNIEYLGLVSLDRYYSILSMADIGLSFRSSKDEEHNFNFPSKILEYLSHGLFVISTKKYTFIDKEVYFYVEENVDALDIVMSNIFSMGQTDLLNKREYIRGYLVNGFTEERFVNAIDLIENKFGCKSYK